MAKRRDGGPGISFFAFQDIITAVVGIFILITLILVLELAQRVESAAMAPTEDIQPIVETTQTLEQQIEVMRVEINQRSDSAQRSSELNAFNVQEKTEQLVAKVKTLESRIAASQSKNGQLASKQFEAEAEAKRVADEYEKSADQRAKRDELAERTRQTREQVNIMLGDDAPIFRDVTEDGRYLVLVTIAPGEIEIRDALLRSTQTFSGSSRTREFESWLADVPLNRRHILVMVRPGGESDLTTIKAAADSVGARYGYTVIGDDDSVRLGYEVKVIP